MTNEVNEILNQDVSSSEKVDLLLKLDNEMYTTLGLDSTKAEREQVTRNSKQIIDAVIELDPNLSYLHGL